MRRARGGIASRPLSNRQARARYRRILRFAGRHLTSLWWWELTLPRLGAAGLSNRTRARRTQRIARQFHDLAVDLGGLMIKLGQFLSTRLDVLPPAITRELEGLQDEVPAVEFEAIAALAERELGVSLGIPFARVDRAPLAAASLGQVHRAELTGTDADLTGLERVVVKVQRPGIDDIVYVDLAALERVAGWLSRIRLVNRRADMPALYREFAATCREEIDYLNEAQNAERFAAQFSGNPKVAVPDVVWERSSRRVLTMQDVTAIKITDLAGLRQAGINPAEVADEFAAIMFDQVFVHGFFHADPHPGNVFVTPRENGWTLTFIDFGMMGEIPSELRSALRTTLLAAAARDGAGMVNGMRQVGVLLPSADTFELERALSQLFERFGGMGFAELQRVNPREFTQFALEFGDLVRALPFQFPENFLLVLRALSLTSGMASSLNPEFNIWNSVEPYAAKLLQAEGQNLVRDAAGQLGQALRVVAGLPGRLDTLLNRIEQGQLSVRAPEVERRLSALERSVRRLIAAVAGVGLGLGALVSADHNSALALVLGILAAPPLGYSALGGLIASRTR